MPAALRPCLPPSLNRGENKKGNRLDHLLLGAINQPTNPLAVSSIQPAHLLRPVLLLQNDVFVFHLGASWQLHLNGPHIARVPAGGHLCYGQEGPAKGYLAPPDAQHLAAVHAVVHRQPHPAGRQAGRQEGGQLCRFEGVRDGWERRRLKAGLQMKNIWAATPPLQGEANE